MIISISVTMMHSKFYSLGSLCFLSAWGFCIS